MRVQRKSTELAEADLTPMIDMTFQLIAFFMVLINFAQTESHDEVTLPQSRLIKPPEQPFEFPIMLHITRDATVYLGGEAYSADTLNRGLNGELAVARAQNMDASDANVIIRAHKDAAAGEVQEVIRACQALDFVNFGLRAKEDLGQKGAG
ncbi:biopolymer transport protein ExbD [Roseimaritima multifibrata]|uniref:Biopolymer transport protein ExbD n=1 Tax=Roseimaritima multifibrata TaxID=1930274 RepID=A0A517MKC0_9BACT|nr:biopolymer transporter ExbD [Roseimaritima multifibrata]QDS95237.1 biopolymer transport protein ExbD [Roseimaritima multifibrata]